MHTSSQGESARLDATFAALADPTRRAILARLASGEASVNELMAPFSMSQPAISKHLKVLERAGLVSRGHDAQRRPRRLEAQPLAEATDYLERYREHWEANYAQLDAVLEELKALEKKPAKEKKMTMNKLTITTPSDREIAMTRAFDAPKRLVYEAYTQPELLKRWLGVQNGFELVVCEIDLRVGGTCRYVWRGRGMSMGMSGVYKEVVPQDKIVSTEEFDEPWYPGEAVGTVTFRETAGKTTVTTTVLYASKEARDGVLKSPMAEGMAGGFDALEALLATQPM